MRQLLLFVLVVPGLSGCEWLQNLTAGKEANPVFGEAPPRTQVAANPQPRETQQTGFRDGPIRPASGTAGAVDPAFDLSGSQVVATVNGEPILASDILERYGPQMQAARVKSGGNEEIMRSVREGVIRRDLPSHIRRKLLVNAFRKSIPQKNLKMLDQSINAAFENRIEDLKKEMKVDTRYEVEEKLAQQGTSLATLRDMFANGQMAHHFYEAKKRTKKVFGRPELRAYYNEHLADYEQKARVRWQEIEIRFAKNGGRLQAEQKMQQAIAALRQGTDFGTVAKQYSDAATAKNGGQEDWIQHGSLADKQLERKLFEELPVGQISSVLESDSAFRIVKLTDREPAGFTPFADVHEDIKKKLEAEAREANAKKVMDDLYADAVIWTIFDKQNAEPQTARPARTAGRGPFGSR